MANTRGLNPREHNKGYVGRPEKQWKEVNAKKVNIDGVDIMEAIVSGSLAVVPDMIHSAALHNGLYRGKDLTEYFESGEMSAAIAAGTFEDIYPGDYIIKSVTIDGTTYSDVKWIVMDLDYHLHAGDTETTAHHVVLMPETTLGTQAMNATNITTGGYVGSVMWTTHIPKVVTGIEAAFGDTHVLSHRELLTNTVDTSIKSAAHNGWTGAASNWAWTDVKVNLANELMVYGSRHASSSFYDGGECTKQLAAFNLNHGLRCSKRQWWWLRAVAGSTDFAGVDRTGDAYSYDAGASSGGVRPYFLLR